VGFQKVKPARPQATVGFEPDVQLDEWLRPKLVQAALRVDAYLDESCLAQHSEVLRYAGLAQAEIHNELSDGALPFSQQVEDPPPRGLGQHRKGHPPSMLERLYVCQEI
jgi:hypothetical protein